MIPIVETIKEAEQVILHENAPTVECIFKKLDWTTIEKIVETFMDARIFYEWALEAEKIGTWEVQEPIKTLWTLLINPSFNPSKDSAVDKLKKLFAEAIDIVNSETMYTLDEWNKENLKQFISSEANSLCLQAQMMCVKAVTFK